MHSIEVIVTTGREAEQFNTAVYRYIELKGSLEAAPSIIIRSEPLGVEERKVVTLWSADAASEFRKFWQDFKMSRHRLASSRYDQEGWT